MYKKGFCVGQFVSTDEEWFHFDALIVKTVECGMLKTDVQCMKFNSICKNLCDVICLENELWVHCSLKRLWKGGGDTFSMCCNITLFMTLLVSVKKNRSKINEL